MNTLTLIFLLCLVCSPPGSLGSAVTLSPGLGPASGVVTSGEVLRMAGDEADLEEDLSGTQAEESTHDSALQFSEEERRSKRKGKGKKRNKHRNKHTTAFQPDTSHSSRLTSNSTSGHTALTSASVTADPCSSSHLTYCIHGMCKYLEDLKEAVCVCLKGFDGERCGIQLLGSRNEEEEEEGSKGELVQTVLVIIAVVLSLMSCIAILLMTCAHYRTQKNFLSAYLGSASEKHELQTPPADGTV
ncbi:proheparin-binding EGF-like growth factor [Hypomesus transpacificus]|uniref:proheparin-binding EGF-like growth factor n=1 Tax=Hypomesus transpacificus TaxID=137520 RepID=UPI001F074294|nr:proheparin-binding EGF-like growth factor [Hypomesus transpacificus]